MTFLIGVIIMKNNVTKILCLFIWMGAMFWVGHASWAADYYVDAVNGLDEPGRGTIDKPWKTITYALSQVSGTGHIIHIAKGTYNLTLGEVFPLSMKDGVNLIGAGSDLTIIDAQDKASVVKAEYISTETTIAGFTLKDGKSSTYGGGIIYRWSSGNLIVDSCKITSCYSAKEGGGIYASESPDGSIIIQNCQITDCTSNAGWGYGNCKGGAGIYVGKTSVGILGCEIFSNRADWGGGAGILIRESQSAEVAFNNIHNNIGYVGGGVLYCVSKGIIRNNFIYSNEATYYSGGGGIYIVPGGESKQVVVCNNLIKGNTVDYDGAGIMVEDSPFFDKTRSYDIIVNNTITANGSDIECRGAGIRLDSTLYYFYTIVKNNIVTGNDIGIEVVMLDPELWKGTVAYNDVWNNECSDYEGIQPGVGDIHEDPMFVDADNGDYHLQSAKCGHWTPDGWSPPDPKTSPCIDAGDPHDDYSLEPEPNGGRINQGYDGNTLEATRSDCPLTDVTPPVAVTNLAISNPTENSITLTWTAPGDDGNEGQATTYDIRYSTSEITDANWDTATQCTGEPAPKPAGEPETFTVTDLSPGTTYYFALKAADEVPNWSGLSNVVSCKTTAKTGDVSGDGNITAFDASLILRVVVGILNLNEPEYPYLTLEVADVSGNGTVSALDAALVLQYTVGLITKFPAEDIVYAPILAGKDENRLLAEALVILENTSLSTEQRQVLEQLKRLLYQQKLLTHTALLQNFPNPFNPETWIPFKLAEGGKATITIYDIHGRLVRTLSLGYVSAGVYQTKAKAAYWDGRNETGERVASGVYFYRLQSGKFSATRKMVVLK
jgi:hypothetical protein